MNDITVERTYDRVGVFDAMLHCFDDITEDGTDTSAIDVNVVRDCWLVFKLDTEVLGYMQLAPWNRTTIDIHPYIYKGARIYSLACGKLALQWFDQHAPDMYKKIVSQVPSCYRHIKRYTLTLGFELEGTHKKAYTKHGKLLDVWLFGRERKNHDNH
jgi:hypothetical protein